MGSDASLRVLWALVPLALRADPSTADAAAVASSLFGMQGFSPCQEVRAVAGALVPAVRGLRELGVEHLGAALVGLQNQTSELDAVPGVLADAARRVGGVEIGWQCVAHALYGTQGMDGGGTRSLLDVVRAGLRCCTERVGAQNLGLALYGVGARGDSPQARRTLESLAEAVEGRVDALDAQSIAN
eukprot:Hpha_TRINITY_DN26749_c0_g1::TRINITY_DN26749_c0_g1_i1::g.138902::m.138902